MRHSAYLFLAILAAGCILDRAGGAPGDGSTSTSATTGGGSLTVAVVTNDASSTTTTVTTSGGGMGGEGGTGGVGGAGGSGGSGPTDPLTNQGLVLRYFLDEAAMGTMPMAASDAAPNPLDLPIDYGMGNLVYSEVMSHQRGLTWALAGDMGVATAGVSNKVINRISGDQRFTIELVADIDGDSSGGARPFVIGKEAGNCVTPFCDELGLSVPESDELRVFFNNASVGLWGAPWMMQGRCVVHAVIDSTVPNAADRAAVYVNGVATLPKGNITVGANETLALSSDGIVALGNRGASTRSPLGTIHYVALYDVPFNATRAAAHSARLLASDDATWPP